jgi:multidrug efflux pump subunit AcrA (membrane-fusion protein)
VQLSPQKAGLSHKDSPYRTHPDPTSPPDNTVAFPGQAVARAAQVGPPPPRQPSRLELLVSLEAAIRQQPTLTALFLHAVNETRQLLGFEQAVLVRFDRRQKARIETVSSVARHDGNGVISSSLERLINRLKLKDKPGAHLISPGDLKTDYPFRESFWAPIADRKGKLIAGLFLLRDTPWEESDGLIIQRIAGCYGHAMRALSPPSLLRKFSIPKWFLIGAPLVILALAFVPVPLTTLAPFEVIADQPALATAPIDGVIAEIIPEPNSLVKTGDPLYRFDATTLKAGADIAKQKVVVAQAKLVTAQQGAFTDQEMKHSLAVTEKELELALAESHFADELLARVTVVAGRDGLVSYASRNDWLGKPVQVGQKVMEIADPRRVAFRIDLAVHDSIALQQGSGVRLFLDSDPLAPRQAEVTEMSFHATEQPGGALAYRVVAKPMAGDTDLRIGLRGTAQLSGENVSLGFYLFRRPIAGLRQYIGW